jgi:hypothetical protein
MSKVENALMTLELLDPSLNSDLEIKAIQYDPNGNPNSDRALNQAKLESLEVKFPAPNELFIDIDNEHSFALYEKQMDIVKKYIGATDAVITTSRHGLPGRHIVVTLDRDVTELERIALQACLGSDRVRELLGFVQYQNNDPHPTLFLELGQKQLQSGVAPLLLGDGSAR